MFDSGRGGGGGGLFDSDDVRKDRPRSTLDFDAGETRGEGRRGSLSDARPDRHNSTLDFGSSDRDRGSSKAIEGGDGTDVFDFE